MTTRYNCKKTWIIAICLLLTFLFGNPSAAYTFGSEPTQCVYVGGFPVGLILKPQGVIVVGAAPIETELGSVIPQIPLQPGDIIESIDGKSVDTAEEIRTVLHDAQEMNAELKVRRGTALLTIPIGLIREDLTGEKRLGLQVRDNIAGIGTVTFVKEDGAFGCLGHPILLDNGGMVNCKTGSAFDCKILGYNKGIRGKAGELKGAFTGSVSCGTLHKNCRTGVFGTFDRYEKDSGKRIEVANRHSVHPGKATILTTVGDTTEAYSIEIIKTTQQNAPGDKSMILRVTDKRLLATTGGIVQGMSGSPIIQNNRLVGAVTHVFISDPTKGYGIYADWMLENG